jgi:hydroxyacyl-ACP dehydratase HTD2-like protein with hotdog domain
MDPKEWKGKSVESELIIDPETIQNTRDRTNKGGQAVEKGDQLKLYEHWLYPAESSPVGNDLSEAIDEEYSISWRSGRIEYRKPLIIGEPYKRIVQVQKADELMGDSSVYLVSFGIKIRSAYSLIYEEEQEILLTKKPDNHEDLRRINFDGDWKLGVKPEELSKISTFKSNLLGHSVRDSITASGDQGESDIPLQGPPSVTLLMNSFTEHFESRKADRLTYTIHGTTDDENLMISGKDTDAFVTSLRLINSKRQVVVGLDVRWSYDW